MLMQPLPVFVEAFSVRFFPGAPGVNTQVLNINVFLINNLFQSHFHLPMWRMCSNHLSLPVGKNLFKIITEDHFNLRSLNLAV